MKRWSPAVGVGRPGCAVEVTNLGESDLGSGRQQPEAFAVVVELAGELIQDSDGGTEGGTERRPVGGQDEEPIGEDRGVGGEVVAEPVEAVAIEVEGDAWVSVEQLDERGPGHGGVVMNLVQDDPVPRLGHGPGIGDGDGVGRANGLARGVQGGERERIGAKRKGHGDAEGRGARPIHRVARAVDRDVGDEERGGARDGGDGLWGGEVIAAVGGDGEGGVGRGVELAEDIGSPRRHVVGDTGDGGEARDVVLLVEESIAINHGDELGRQERAVGSLVQGPPQHPPEGRLVV